MDAVTRLEPGDVGRLNVLTEGGAGVDFHDLSEHGDRAARRVDLVDRTDDGLVDVHLVGNARVVGVVLRALDAGHLADGELRLVDRLSVLADRGAGGLEMDAVDVNAAKPGDGSGRDEWRRAGRLVHAGATAPARHSDYRDDSREEELSDPEHVDSPLIYCLKVAFARRAGSSLTWAAGPYMSHNVPPKAICRHIA